MDAKDNRKEMSAKKYAFSMDKIALFIVLIFSILGVGITNFRPLESYRYWGGMTIVLAITAMVIGWAKSKQSQKPCHEIFVIQLVHWAATAATVAGVFLLLNMGRLNYENTGLVLLLILGLSTFLDGYRISWSFALIGLMMFFTGLLAGYVESYVWITIITIVCVLVIIIIIEKYKGNAYVPAKNENAQDKRLGKGHGESKKT